VLSAGRDALALLTNQGPMPGNELKDLPIPSHYLVSFPSLLSY